MDYIYWKGKWILITPWRTELKVRDLQPIALIDEKFEYYKQAIGNSKYKLIHLGRNIFSKHSLFIYAHKLCLAPVGVE